MGAECRKRGKGCRDGEEAVLMPVVIDWSGWGVSATEPPLTDGNLALDVEPLGEVEPGPVTQIGGTPSRGNETAHPAPGEARGEADKADEEEEIEHPFSLQAREYERLDERTLKAIVTAFKVSCRRCGVVYRLGQDEHGWPRVVLNTLSGAPGGVAMAGLGAKLEQMPQLEAALLIELSWTDAGLRDTLEERAAIRAADGLSDDEMTVALLTIGAAIDAPE